jgi:hypothetical protein
MNKMNSLAVTEKMAAALEGINRRDFIYIQAITRTIHLFNRGYIKT